LKRLRTAGVSPAALEYLEGRLAYAGGKVPEAVAALERAAPGLAKLPGMAEPAKTAYILLGRCYEAQGKGDQQSSAYRRALEVPPPGSGLDQVARLGLAAALSAREKVDEAVDEYRKLLAQPSPPPEARLALSRLLVARALRSPESQRGWPEVERALDDAERAAPDSPEVAVLRGEVLLARRKPDEASALIRSARDKAPDRVELWVAQAELERRAGRPEEALRLVEEAERRLGRRVELRQARAAYWAGRTGREAVDALTELERSAADLGPDDRRRLFGALAAAYTRVGDAGGYRRLIKRWADEEPNNLRLRLALFEETGADGDDASADRLLDDIRRLDVEGSAALYAEAALLVRRASKDDGPSLERARRLL
ncbi:MAG: hypothetical protein LC708_03970, partial [Actinobacteria bacterium]|nr:hypothetical protein [Actinomycetota bacterium]